jgi:surface protein
MVLTLFIAIFLTAYVVGIKGAQAADTDDFVITVKTDNDGVSSDTQFKIPIRNIESYNYHVDCDNDGTNEANNIHSEYTCEYLSPGTYTIRIKDAEGDGTGFPYIYFNGGGDTAKLMTIAQWGTGKWTSMRESFLACTNMTVTATDAPDLSNVTDLSYMFYSATQFDADISHWDTSHVTDMGSMFEYATSFNQDLNTWDTSHVTDMTLMFRGASDFNGAIGDWDISNVWVMYAMFSGASAFNQDIGDWDVSHIGNLAWLFEGATSFNQDIGAWNVSNVGDFQEMFKNAIVFNQDISGWDTSSGKSFHGMFEGATAFDQNLGGWDVMGIIDVTADIDDMFAGVKLSTANYDALLMGWNSQALINAAVFDAGSSTYCQGEAARANMVTNHGWTIFDGGKNCGISIYIPLTVK